MASMKRAGRLNWIAMVGVLGIAVIGFLMFFGQKSSTSNAIAFMEALGNKDVDRLVELSSWDGDKEDLRKKWDYSVNTAGKYYVFRWEVLSEKKADDNHSAVKLTVFRNAFRPQTFPEKFELPMVREGDEWKVDVRGLSHQIFPATPR